MGMGNTQTVSYLQTTLSFQPTISFLSFTYLLEPEVECKHFPVIILIPVCCGAGIIITALSPLLLHVLECILFLHFQRRKAKEISRTPAGLQIMAIASFKNEMTEKTSRETGMQPVFPSGTPKY